MTALLQWGGPLVYWTAATWGGRGVLQGLGLIRCRAGDWGTAFLTGFTLSTLFVYAGALAGAPIARPLLMAASGATLILGLLLRGRRALPAREIHAWTWAERLLLAGFAGYCLLIVQSAVYFPTTATDAHSYDGRALFLLHDRRLDLGLYHWPGGPVTAQTNISYPPLLSIALASVYAMGGWQPQLVIAGFALAWPLVLYGALRQRIPRYAALAWTLFLALTPEVFSHASHALLNLPAMALIAAEAVALARFLGGGGQRWLALAAAMAAGAAGVRPDALIVHGALWILGLGFALAGPSRRIARARRLGIYLLAGAAPALTWGSWALYLRYAIGLEAMLPVAAAQRLGPGPVLEAGARLLWRWDIFGATFFAWLIALPSVFRRRRSDPEARFFHFAVLAVLAALVAAFSLIDPRYGGGVEDVLSMSFKRALFYLVPLAGLASALSPPWRGLARRGFGWVHGQRPADPAQP